MYRNFLHDSKYMLYALIISGVLVPVSILLTAVTGSAKFFSVGMLLFVCTTFWNMRLLALRSKLRVNEFISAVHRQELEAKEEKRHFDRFIYSILPSLIVTGFIFIVLLLVASFILI